MRQRFPAHVSPLSSFLPNQTSRYQVAADRVHSEYLVVDTATGIELAWHPLSPAGYQAAYRDTHELNSVEAVTTALVLADEQAARDADPDPDPIPPCPAAATVTVTRRAA